MNEATVVFLRDAVPLWLAFTSVLAVILTAADKHRARKKQFRIRERTLLAVGALGGAFAEFLTMVLLHHKTQHLKFMLLLPLFFALHAAALFALYFLM